MPTPGNSCSGGTGQFSTTLRLHEQRANVVAFRPILIFVKDLDCRIFPLLEDFSCYPNTDEDVVKALNSFGVIEFSNSAGRPSGPTDFQFGVPSIIYVTLP